jgi:hypothetical protein
MFVRWKRRPMSRRGTPTGEKALSAVLVESVRVDGRPRQRIISHLGTIQEHGLPHFWHQVDFWKAATLKLDGAGLTPDERSAIEAALAKVVPVPDRWQEAVAAAELRRLERASRVKA